MNPVQLSSKAARILKTGRVFVPSPLALDGELQMDESYQRLLTLYYIKSGAAAVIPGAHTGEFAANNSDLLQRWMKLVKDVASDYAGDLFIHMAAIGGNDVLDKAERVAGCGYDIAMVAPTAFEGKSEEQVIELLKEIASIIPVFGFELQRAIPGSYAFTTKLWHELFRTCYGAKGASFDTYKSMQMLEAAAASEDPDALTLLTGNDDRIVSDILGRYTFPVGDHRKTVRYDGGLLGHFATDTHAVRNWMDALINDRDGRTWVFELSKNDLAHAVNRCNMVLFDALGNFANSVWGVKYRLTKLGLLPAPYCFHEHGAQGQADAIDTVYAEYPALTDDEFLQEHLRSLKREAGINE